MKKTIILSNGVKKDMTFEEVLKQFKPMIYKAANIHKRKFERTELEDLVQEMHIETFKAYEEYNGVNAFSTILTFKLQKVTGNDSQKVTAQKRTSKGGISMNAVISEAEEMKLEDVFAEEDYTAESMIAKEMKDLILANLDEREQAEFLCIQYPNEYSVVSLAESRGISRQATNQRINRTKTRLQDLMKANGYAN